MVLELVAMLRIMVRIGVLVDASAQRTRQHPVSRVAREARGRLTVPTKPKGRRRITVPRPVTLVLGIALASPARGLGAPLRTT
jgi:hypothetical protein